MTVLTDLQNDELYEIGQVVSTPDALSVVLKQRNEVFALRRALEQGAVTPEHVRSFVMDVLSTFERGKVLHDDVTLAALAVALETLPGPFPEEYIERLSALKVGELPMSWRVAALARVNRARALGGHTFREFVAGRHGAPAGRARLVEVPEWICSGTSYADLAQAA